MVKSLFLTVSSSMPQELKDSEAGSKMLEEIIKGGEMETEELCNKVSFLKLEKTYNSKVTTRVVVVMDSWTHRPTMLRYMDLVGATVHKGVAPAGHMERSLQEALAEMDLEG